MALPPAIAPRVGALLRMMASPIDGEALGAARAIDRTLKGAGVDWHALADVVERPVVAVVVERREPAPRRAKRNRAARPGDIDLDFMRRRSVVEALRRGLAGNRLSGWETEFATSILSRMQCGRGRLTERQGETLSRLLQKLGEGKAWV